MSDSATTLGCAAVPIAVANFSPLGPWLAERSVQVEHLVTEHIMEVLRGVDGGICVP